MERVGLSGFNSMDARHVVGFLCKHIGDLSMGHLPGAQDFGDGDLGGVVLYLRKHRYDWIYADTAVPS